MSSVPGAASRDRVLGASGEVGVLTITWYRVRMGRRVVRTQDASSVKITEI